ncbi:MAG: UDP-3-O-acyl-N-acetylglucosamine deacetylase, partial [Nitrospinota bacterium]
ETAVKAVKLGAFDFIEKPLSIESVLAVLERALGQRRRSRTQEGPRPQAKLLGSHPHISALREALPHIASQEGPLLLWGEAGTGKEFLARLIHEESPRREAPFLKVSCAVQPEEALEEALSAGKASREASPGTLFLDDVDRLSPKAQEFLLKALGQASGVRLIGAMTAEPTGRVKSGVLSAELLEFIGGTVLALPPLRERKEDVHLLARHFLGHFCKQHNKGRKELDKAALSLLSRYSWPGNIKELKNLMERLALNEPGRRLGPESLPPAIRFLTGPEPPARAPGYSSLRRARRAWEREFIARQLSLCGWDIPRAARVLQLTEKSLIRKMRAMGIEPEAAERSQPLSQRTLCQSMVLCGQGLHSGLKTGLILQPLPPNSGIQFGAITMDSTVPAHIDYVLSTVHATTLRRGPVQARTIEHLMAVLHAYRITNLLVKISGEVPIMDGSALDFCQIIEDAGIQEQGEAAPELCPDKIYWVGDEGNGDEPFLKIEPAPGFSVRYLLRYPPPVGEQEFFFELQDPQVFKEEIAPARTFGFLKDVERLEKLGLIGGGRLDNVILLDEGRVINTELRFADEFVRHKILDILGDFYLLGRVIRGKVTARMSGHSENISLLRKLASACPLP